MHVDQTGRDNHAGGVDHLIGRNRGAAAHRGDFSPFQEEIHDGVDALAGID